MSADAGEDDAVLLEAEGGVAVIRLNRPAERNPLSVSTLERLAVLFSSLDARDDIRAVIFTGAGDDFGAAVVAVEAGLGDEDADFLLAHLLTSAHLTKRPRGPPRRM